MLPACLPLPQTRTADPALVHEVLGALDDAAEAGLTVVRCWAFADGMAQWNALQPAPGVFQERVFRALDFVMAEAGRRGLKLLLALTNYWQVGEGRRGGPALNRRWHPP